MHIRPPACWKASSNSQSSLPSWLNLEASALLTDTQPGYRHTSTTIMSSAVATSSRLRIVASIDDVGGQLPDGSLAVVQYGLKALDDLFQRYIGVVSRGEADGEQTIERQALTSDVRFFGLEEHGTMKLTKECAKVMCRRCIFSMVRRLFCVHMTMPRLSSP